MTADLANRFEALRPELVRHAYRMLGEYGEAEDVAQDAYLRWSAAFDAAPVENERALARTIVTRLCLDRMRSARARREVYFGPWLPEPVISEGSDDPAAAAALADDISFALLVALERLAPLERAAFLLHDVLDVPFGEVAQTLGRAEPAVRKLASRAREHVRDAGRRSHADPNELLRVRDAFLAAIQNDDPAALERLLADDVVFTSDGGGKAPGSDGSGRRARARQQVPLGAQEAAGLARRRAHGPGDGQRHAGHRFVHRPRRARRCRTRDRERQNRGDVRRAQSGEAAPGYGTYREPLATSSVNVRFAQNSLPTLQS